MVNNQKLIQYLSISVAAMVFVAEVIPFLTGYESLPDLITDVTSNSDKDESQNTTITISTPTEIKLPQPPKIEKLQDELQKANISPPPPLQISSETKTVQAIDKKLDCGQYWTAWVSLEAKPANPCPKECENAQVLMEEKRINGFPPTPEQRIQYQCLKQ